MYYMKIMQKLNLPSHVQKKQNLDCLSNALHLVIFVFSLFEINSMLYKLQHLEIMLKLLNARNVFQWQ